MKNPEEIDTMDLTSRYRTRLPPREHRETVRMLMRSIGATDANKATSITESRRIVDLDGRGSSKVLPQRNLNNYQSRATTVSERDKSCSHKRAPTSRRPVISEVSSSHDSEYENQQEAETSPTTPSNTVSSSSLKADMRTHQDNQEDDRMFKGESIPSRTIAIQCELKVSSATGKRQDNSMQASSISSTRYGFYNYSAETLAQRRKLQRSISNWNIAEEQPNSCDEDKLDTEVKQVTTSGLHSESFESNDEQEDEEESSPRRRSSVSVESSVARGRVHSLSRRPTTAFSYVSSSRIKDASNDDDDEQSLLKKPTGRQSCAMSQMNLTRPHTPVVNRESSSHSCSDCDQCSRTNSSSSHKSSGTSAARAISRPTLVSSSRNEHVRGYKTLERLPVSRRKVTEENLDADSYNWSKTSTTVQDSSSIDDRIRQRTKGRVNRMLDNSVDGQSKDLYERQERINSMSLNRKPKPCATPRYSSHDSTSGYCTTQRVTRRASTIANNRQHQDRLNNQEYVKGSTGIWSSSSGSNKAEPLTATDRYDSGLYDSASSGNQSYHHKQQHQFEPVRRRPKLNSRYVDEFDYEVRKSRRNGLNEDTDEDSDCSLSKTWANPSSRPSSARGQVPVADGHETHRARHKVGPTRSHSMRDVNADGSVADRSYMQECCIDYYKKQAPLHYQQVGRDTNQQRTLVRRDYESSPESSLLNGDLQREYLRSQAVNYDSQHRLNEIGLPEVDRHSTMNHTTRASSSQLSLNNTRVYQTGHQLQRSPTQVAGRAVSQQQLIRPSMPSSRRRRTDYLTGNSASDAGGSSLSLAGNRLPVSRHELAYTRSPVVMYIPQVGSDLGRSGASSGHEDDMMSIGKGSRLRRTLRSRQMSRLGGSQDISLGSRGRSVSRNGSDSESSSMLRTLIRAKGSKPLTQQQQTKQQRLMTRYQVQRQAMNENHNEDHIGQLATEIDSGKFRRRYSVPRNAKINWFSKLKQRVSSSVKS